MPTLNAASPRLFVISGTQGAGKTTVASALARRLDRCARVSADDFELMILSGRVWPDSKDMSDEARAQLALRLENACLVARSFLHHGFNVVLEDSVIGTRMDDLKRFLAGQPFAFVMLTPTSEVVRAREASRGTELWTEWCWLEEEISQRTERIGLWLDNSHLTVEQTVEVILERWPEACVN